MNQLQTSTTKLANFWSSTCEIYNSLENSNQAASYDDVHWLKRQTFKATETGGANMHILLIPSNPNKTKNAMVII